MNDAIEIQLCRLTSDEYSVPKGSLGYIEDQVGTNAAAVSWVYDPGPGGGSVPVLVEHLEPVGKLLVKIPEQKPRWAGGDALLDAALTAWDAGEGVDGDRWRMRAALDAALRTCRRGLYESYPTRDEDRSGASTARDRGPSWEEPS